MVFAFESSWIALSGLFSMAFDENTHLAIMELYVNNHRLLPFWSSQPLNSLANGALTHDPSYMYRFLMSFPYRWMAPFVQTEPSQVLVLRFFSIVLLGIGIVLFRKLLLRTGASRAMVNTAMAVFVLLPVTPLLAAQINYDNLMLPIIALTLWFAMNVNQKFKKEKKLDVVSMVLSLSLAMFNCLVMYACLPILLAVGLWFAYIVFLQFRHLGWKKLWRQIWRDFNKVSPTLRLALVAWFVLCTGLFLQAYGVNMVKYHTPVPDCNQVLSIDECMNYSPWRRDFQSHNDLVAGNLARKYSSDPVSFTIHDWIKQMAKQVFYTLNGQAQNFQIGEPLPLPKLLAWLLGPLGVGLSLWWYKDLRRKYRLDLLIFVSAAYVFILWFREYTGFLYDGYAVAIQGRYLIPVLPVFLLVLGLAYSRALRAWSYLKPALAWLVIAVLLLEGGGSMVYIIRSNDSWYWPNATVRRVNNDARQIMKKFVIGA